MLDRYDIENIEQLRAIADMLRLRIIDQLLERPMTVTQLGDVLGEAPAKVHYHVRELEKVSLLRLVETREKGGILEKYYQPVAREFSVDKSLFSAHPDESTAMLDSWLGQMKDGFLRAFRVAREQKDEQQQKEKLQRLSLGFTTLYLTAGESQELVKQISALSRPYEKRRGIEGEQEMLASLLIYPQDAPLLTSAEAGVRQVEDMRTVGTANFSRADLEKALARGTSLRVHVVGTCSFADDITPDLADQAIEYLHVTGTLQASPVVREVLLKKQA